MGDLNKIGAVTVMAGALLCSSALAAPEISVSDEGALSRYLDNRRFERPIDRRSAKYSITPIQELRFFDHYSSVRFVVFPTAASTLTGHVALAVDDDGDVFEVGKEADFNRLIRALRVRVNTASEAELVARDYLRLRNIHAEIWEGVEGGLNFLSTVDDIPFDEDSFEHRVERFDLQTSANMTAPSIESSDVGFWFRGISWAPFGGQVAEHSALVRFDGTVEYRQERVAYPYGKYRTGCTLPMDYGPSVDVLSRLSRHPTDDAQTAVAEYLDFLVTSDFGLHESFVEEHRGEIEAIASRLAAVSDESIRLPASRVLRVLNGNADAR